MCLLRVTERVEVALLTRYGRNTLGGQGYLHGGVLFTLMDEAVAWSLYYSGLCGVTAKAETRFKNPAPVGASLVITGAVVKRARRLVRVRAEVQRADSNNEKLAELMATMYLLDEVIATRLGKIGKDAGIRETHLYLQ